MRRSRFQSQARSPSPGLRTISHAAVCVSAPSRFTHHLISFAACDHARAKFPNRDTRRVRTKAPARAIALKDRSTMELNQSWNEQSRIGEGASPGGDSSRAIIVTAPRRGGIRTVNHEAAPHRCRCAPDSEARAFAGAADAARVATPQHRVASRRCDTGAGQSLEQQARAAATPSSACTTPPVQVSIASASRTVVIRHSMANMLRHDGDPRNAARASIFFPSAI